MNLKSRLSDQKQAEKPLFWVKNLARKVNPA